LNFIASWPATLTGASLLALAQASWQQPLAKIDLLQQQLLLWQRCEMQQVNLLSSIAAKEISESASLLQNDFQVYVTLFQLEHLLRCKRDLQLKF
jgi:hypothetical protein